MTHQELAEKLNGRIYGDEITDEEIEIAKSHNLLVCFGYSDDNIELKGAINDEVGASGSGTEISIIYTGELMHVDMRDVEQTIEDACDRTTTKLLYHLIRDLKQIKVIDKEHSNLTFNLYSDAPHTQFLIMDDDDPEEVYCKGCVVDISSLLP